MAVNETIKLEINGSEVTAPRGGTVLRAAEVNNIYIPTRYSLAYLGDSICKTHFHGKEDVE